MKLHNKLCGYYKIDRVVNAGTALEYKVPLLDWFPNLITNNGLDRFCTTTNTGGSPTINGTCLVGAGNTVPQFTDTGLASLLGSSDTFQTAGVIGNSGTPLYYSWGRVIYRFNPGVGTGNISEIGIGWSANVGDLFSRALVLDALGNPTTITKLSDETLDVTYELRLYPNLNDFTGAFSLTGNKAASFTYTGRVANVNNAMAMYTSYGRGDISGFVSNIRGYAYTGDIGSITAEPSGYIIDITGIAAPYISGTYTRNITYTFGLTVGNNALGIKSFRIDISQGEWQLQMNTPIMKTSSDILTLNVQVSCGRV